LSLSLTPVQEDRVTDAAKSGQEPAASSSVQESPENTIVNASKRCCHKKKRPHLPRFKISRSEGQADTTTHQAATKITRTASLFWF
jgi:hypothetical protein